jgi:cytochrome c556
VKTFLKISICLFIVAGILGGAYAQFDKPEDAIKYRQAVMFLIAKHFGRMGAVVKGQKSHDREEFARDAALVETLSKLPWDAFKVPGTDKGKTNLKSVAFRKQADFIKAAEKFEIEAGKLVKASDSGDLSVIKEQFGKVGQSCGACHKTFKAK